MIELNKNNYEAWMADWLEGKLSTAREKALVQFLDQHPELHTLTPESDLMILYPPDNSYPDKSELFKSGFSIPEASEDEIECIANLEGDLLLADQESFAQSLSENPSKAALFEQFAHLRLVADESVVFSDKAVMKKKVFLVPAFVYGVLATAAALVLGWFVLLPKFVGPENVELANDNKREIIYLDKLAHPARFDKVASTEPGFNLAHPLGQPEHEIKLIARAPLGLIARMPLLIPETLGAVIPEHDLHLALAPKKPGISEDLEYETIFAFSGDMIRERLLKQDPGLVKKTKFSFWELADAGLQRVSGFLNLSADIDRSYNDEGDLVSVAFDSRLFAFDTPIHR